MKFSPAYIKKKANYMQKLCSNPEYTNPFGLISVNVRNFGVGVQNFPIPSIYSSAPILLIWLGTM